jgi:hypothetical protein
MGFLSGMRVHDLDKSQAVISIRYRWLVKNPFNSMFWAVMGMGAEMSTGILLLIHTHKREPATRFILVANTSSFYKKARGRIRFICNDGQFIETTLSEMNPGESRTITLRAQASNASGEIVADFNYDWRLSVDVAKS